MARRRYETVRVYMASGKEYDIPVDKDGYVPTDALVRHFMSGRNPKKGNAGRSPSIDYGERADVVLPEKLTPSQAAAWWDSPAEYDIEGIDTPGHPKKRKGMDFYGTEKEADRMSVLVDSALTPKERKVLTEDGVSYTARPLRGGLAGLYRPGIGEVELDRISGMDTSTVAHESAHALREKDGVRRGRVLVTQNEARNVEESCTVAEEMARSDRPSAETGWSGYYAMVPVFDERTRRWRNPTTEEAKRMCEEDHAILTYGKGKPLKGDDALRSVEENWSKTNIARLRCSGRSMAIATLAKKIPSMAAAKDAALERARGPLKGKAKPSRKKAKSSREKLEPPEKKASPKRIADLKPLAKRPGRKGK